MLPRDQRLTTSAEFARAIRRGRRAGGRRLVVHLLQPVPGEETSQRARVGFVVSRAVGGAVVRNTVLRRLRHLARGHVDEFPAGTLLVVRALPPAAGVSSVLLGADLEQQLARLSGQRGASVPVGAR